MRAARSFSLIVVVLALALAVAACASDGRSLPAPPATNPTTTLATSTASDQPQIGSAGAPLVLASSAFAAGGAIPIEHTCEGAGTSPPLGWTGVPAGAGALALTVVDTDANGFIHWAVTGIPGAVRSIGAGAVPEGATEGQSSKGTTGWAPPCPPAGSGPHHYVFTLFVLQDGCMPQATVDDIARCAAASTTLVGTYQHS